MKTYSLPQAARHFSIDPELIREALSKKEIFFRPINRTEWRLVENELQAWLDSKTKRPYTPKIQTLDDLAREQYGMSVAELFATVGKDKKTGVK